MAASPLQAHIFPGQVDAAGLSAPARRAAARDLLSCAARRGLRSRSADCPSLTFEAGGADDCAETARTRTQAGDDDRPRGDIGSSALPRRRKRNENVPRSHFGTCSGLPWPIWLFVLVLADWFRIEP